jgi:hypothetical protein
MAREAEQKQTEFLGQPYNFIDWVKSTSEREHYLRYEVVRAGELAPDFALPLLEGGELSLSDLRGKPVMIEFGSIT